jgi:hypothetical protein
MTMGQVVTMTTIMVLIHATIHFTAFTTTLEMVAEVVVAQGLAVVLIALAVVNKNAA